MSNLSCGTHVAEPTANIDCRKLLNQFCRFLPKLKLPISADAKLPLTGIYSISKIVVYALFSYTFFVVLLHNSSCKSVSPFSRRATYSLFLPILSASCC